MASDTIIIRFTLFFFFNDTATTEIYTRPYTLSLHDALPIAQVCGAAGPWIFGHLIGDQQHPDPTRLFYGYLFAAVIMVQAGVVEALIGVKAERMPLEDIAEPLSAV